MRLLRRRLLQPFRKGVRRLAQQARMHLPEFQQLSRKVFRANQYRLTPRKQMR